MNRRDILKGLVLLTFPKSVIATFSTQKEYPLAKLKEETVYNHHDGRLNGNWKQMCFKFDHKQVRTDMYIDGQFVARWSRILDHNDICYVSIDFYQLFSKKPRENK